jgi:hypothetical protein
MGPQLYAKPIYSWQNEPQPYAEPIYSWRNGPPTLRQTHIQLAEYPPPALRQTHIQLAEWAPNSTPNPYTAGRMGPQPNTTLIQLAK